MIIIIVITMVTVKVFTSFVTVRSTEVIVHVRPFGLTSHAVPPCLKTHFVLFFLVLPKPEHGGAYLPPPEHMLGSVNMFCLCASTTSKTVFGVSTDPDLMPQLF
eukprot:6914462-Heterocapsa_arctica.AAC.1